MSSYRPLQIDMFDALDELAKLKVIIKEELRKAETTLRFTSVPVTWRDILKRYGDCINPALHRMRIFGAAARDEVKNMMASSDVHMR